MAPKHNLSTFAEQNLDSLERSISRYAWVVNYYDNWEMDCLVKHVYATFEPLPEPEGHQLGRDGVTTRLPGYNVEAAMAKEIYEMAFDRPIPCPTNEAASEAERAGQVYHRNPSTFYQDLKPRLSGPASNSLLENLRHRLHQAMQRRLAVKARRYWNADEEQAERAAAAWVAEASIAPDNYFEALRISNGIYGMGLTEITMLDSVQDVLAYEQNFDDLGPTLPDAVRSDTEKDVLDSFKIASSPSHNAWYCIGIAFQEPKAPPTPIWELVCIHGHEEAISVARDVTSYLGYWSDTMLESIKDGSD